MREKILTFIEKNSRIDLKELAIILGVDEASVVNELQKMEEEHIICGYHTLIDWDKAGIEKVTALIEVRVTPQRGMGFDKVHNFRTPFPSEYGSGQEGYDANLSYSAPFRSQM